MIIRNKNTARELVKHELNNIKSITVRESFDDQIIYFMEKRNISYKKLSDKEFNNKYKDSQGIVVEISDYEYKDIDLLIENKKENSIVLILDSIEDPQNLGNIVRSFDIFGGDFIVIPKARSVEVNETVYRVSEGAVSYVNIAQVSNLSQTMDKLKKKGYWIYGAHMDGESLYDEIDPKGNIAIVIGNEGFGISKLIKEHCDSLIRIPMVGKINSLNASISAAVIISNIVSRRK